jgi:hypothetical protein
MHHSCVAIFSNPEALKRAVELCRNGNTEFLGYTLADEASLNPHRRFVVSVTPEFALIVAITSPKPRPFETNETPPFKEALTQLFTVPYLPVTAMKLGLPHLEQNHSCYALSMNGA